MEVFDRRLANLPAELWQAIALIDEVKGQWANNAGLTTQVLGRLQRSVLVTSAGASTRIEGARLSDDEVEQLMRGLHAQPWAERDAQEVRGYLETLQLVFDAWQDMPLTENTVKQLHSRLLCYSDADERHRGAYKTVANRVQATGPDGDVVGVLFDTAPPYLTAKQMSELVAWTDQALTSGAYHPLPVIGNFVVTFLKIHPFLDGNGRLSRVLTNLLMLRAGYPYTPYVSHEYLVEVSKMEYDVALGWSHLTMGTKRETIRPWLTYFLGVLRTQAVQAAALVNAEAIETLLSPRQLAVWWFLSEVAEATQGEIASATGVARPTVGQALDKLLQFGAIERLGPGRGARYRRARRRTAEPMDHRAD
jgi:Fic family protein